MFGVAGDDEDDYADFKSPASGSRLASLFASDGGVGQNTVETFRFQAPKQPKAGKNSRTGPALGQQDPNPESDNNEGTKSAAKQAAASGNVLHAVPVHAFLFVNGQYKAQGRLGAAVVGNFSIREYKLWLYVTQQRPVTTARIHPDFTITVQKDHYCSFHDDRRQPWSLLFASHTAVCEFVTQVCLARWFSSSQEMKRPMTQDLAQGEGPTLEEGDTVEVEFTGWLLGNGKLGKVFDGNSDKEKGLRFRLGKGKVLKGWEKGVLGMRKDGQRLILVPSSLGYGERGLAGHVPPNANLAFNILIKRLRSRKNGSSDKQSTSSQESATPSPVPTTFEQQAESLLIPPMTVPGPPGWDRLSDESVRSRSQSLSEQLKHADTTKATLISRMARVGQPMLPQLPARTSPLDTCSDSDTEDLDKHAPTTHADKLPTMISQPQPTSQPQPQPQPQPQAMPRFQDSSGSPHAQHHPIQLVSRPYVDPESRPSSQHLFAASSNYPFAYVPSTAPAALPSFPPAQQLLLPGMADLAWLVGEMRQHHTDIRLTMGGLSERLDSLGHKVEDVSLNTRQLLDGRPESSGQQQMDRTRLAQLEDDKLHLSREKDKVMVQLQVLEEELKSVKSNLEETQEELKKSKRERDELDSKSEETEKHLQETRADLHQALEQGEFLRTRTVVMQRKFEEELQKRTEDESTQVVKQAMNAVYRCLRHQFAPDQTYSGKGVLNCVIAALKNTMMNIVQGGGSKGHDDEGGTEEEHEDSLKKEDEQERMGGTEEECSNCQSEATPEFAENDANGLQPPPVPDAECDDGDHQSCS